jgi:ketosteroid isomerase-like protein
MTEANDVVTRFWRAVDQHDWDTLEACLHPDFVRIGMRDNAEDTCSGRDNYMNFVRGVVGKMDYHDLQTLRVFWSADGRFAVSEAIETITPPGETEKLSMRFSNVHEISEDGLISKLDIYWKSPPRQPPEWIDVDSVLERDSSS